MKICQLAANVESVPPTGYGGTEVVVSLLTERLVLLGHDVTLFATGDSKTKAKLESVVESGLRANSNYLQRQWQSFDLQSLLKLKKMCSQFDIVHNHMGYQALPFLAELSVPVVTTIHNPVKTYNFPIYEEFSQLPFVSISNAFRQLNHPKLLNYVATVYNGIDLEQYPYSPSKRDKSYLLFLARICQDKGTAEAIELAKRLSVPLKIAGKVDEPDRPYFESKIKPKLDSSIEYVGEVNHKEKIGLYTNARALVHAINFDEPFGLTMVEAMACGTAVLAIDRGSVSELIVNNKTGVVAKNIEDLAKRFGEVEKINPMNCRQHVEEKFSKERMVQDYINAYQLVIGDFASCDPAKGYVQARRHS